MAFNNHSFSSLSIFTILAVAEFMFTNVLSYPSLFFFPWRVMIDEQFVLLCFVSDLVHIDGQCREDEGAFYVWVVFGN